MKYQIAYSKKIQTRPYESIGISLSADLDTDETPMDEGYDLLKSTVHEWLTANLEAQGIRRAIV